MIEVYGWENDGGEDGSGGVEYYGSITMEGEIEEAVGGHESSVELVAQDYEQLSLEEVLSLHSSHHLCAVDARDPDEIPEKEKERIRDREARDELLAAINMVDKSDQVERIDPSRILSSHENPFAFEMMMAAVTDVYDEEWLERIKRCDSERSKRRVVAQSERPEAVVRAIASQLQK